MRLPGVVLANALPVEVAGRVDPKKALIGVEALRKEAESCFSRHLPSTAHQGVAPITVYLSSQRSASASTSGYTIGQDVADCIKQAAFGMSSFPRPEGGDATVKTTFRFEATYQ